jgi:hypothetical protein
MRGGRKVTSEQNRNARRDIPGLCAFADSAMLQAKADNYPAAARNAVIEAEVRAFLLANARK